MEDSLKTKTARSIKWNIIDRFGSQVLYAVTGIVLARVLSYDDFGLTGAILIFQAFASLLIDSGFSYALIQRKNPSHLDYSTVLWFNLGVSVVLYAVLWLCAPLIAAWFDNDLRLIPLSRVMFLTFILNASAIVQTNILMKKMNVRPIAVSNAVGLLAGAVVGIWLALTGFGAWAIVWQAIVVAAVKSLLLWITGKWRPLWQFSWQSLRSFFGIGSRMMLTSFLNTLFQNIYSFFIGHHVGLTSLGYYTQSDKWSKMGISSLSQVLTSSFLPVLSAVQDDGDRFRHVSSKMNRFTAYLLFPVMVGLIVMATPIFHLLFGTKWDASIILFQLLLVKGIFTVLNSLYNNYVLALGKARLIMWLEVLRDGASLIALVITMPYMALTLPNNPVYGITILLWGQIISSVITWVATLVVTVKAVNTSLWSYLRDLAPYVVLTAVIAPLMMLTDCLSLQIVIGAGLYIGCNALLHSQIQADMFNYLRGKKLNMD
jgi:O-antigen/teichoic acid export membrane protein